MNDLELWQRLSELDEHCDLQTLGDLVAALGESMDATSRERVPLFGFVPSMVAHSHPPLRAAAIAMLGGVEGQTGIELIVAGLDDEDARVRAEAVRALRTSSARGPGRWAHAIFHPRVDVRRLALDHDPPGGMKDLGAYLRADPELAEEARACPWPSDRCGLVFDLVLRGHIDDAEAGDAFVDADVGDLREVLRRSVRRRAEPVLAALDAFVEGQPLDLAQGDLLDVLCRVYWANAQRLPQLFNTIADACLLKRDDLRPRFAYALLSYGDKHGHLPEALQAAVAVHPAILSSPRLSIDERRLAAIGLRRHRAHLSPFAAKRAAALIRDQAYVGRGRDLDLSLAVCLANHAKGSVVPALLAVFDEDTLVRAAIDQPQSWPSLIELPNLPRSGPLWFLDRIAKLDRDAAADFIAEGIMQWRAEHARLQRSKKKPRPTVFDRVLNWLNGPGTVRLFVRVLGSGAPIDAKALTKLVEEIERKLSTADITDLYASLLPNAEWEPQQIVLRRVTDRRNAKTVARAIADLDTPSLQRFCQHADALGLQLNNEKAIVELLKDHADPRVAAWVARMLESFSPKPVVERPRNKRMRKLSPKQTRAIRLASPDELVKALEPALAAPTIGLCDALRERPTPDEPSTHAVVALIACGDRLAEVSEQLERFAATDAEFHEQATVLAVAKWAGNDAISPLGHAWLSNWEQHKKALLAWLDGVPSGLSAVLRGAAGLVEGLARQTMWRGIAAAVLFRRYRQGARLQAWGTEDVIDALVAQLDTDLGEHAARILATFHTSNVGREHLDAVHERVVLMVPDMDAATRRELERWVRIVGLQARVTPARRVLGTVRRDRLDALQASTDLAQLVKYCAAPNAALANEAVLRLIELEEPGQECLAILLETPPSEATMQLVAESVPLWSDGAALQRVRTLAEKPLDPHRRFRVVVGLVERGEEKWSTAALQAAAAPSPSTWLTKKDWETLLTLVPNMRMVSLALAGCVHPHAYQRAVGWLVNHGGDDEDVGDALLGFLRAGSQRPVHLRREVARLLLTRGDLRALVVFVGELLDVDVDLEESKALVVLCSLDEPIRARVLELVTETTLLNGRAEARCFAVLQGAGVSAAVLDPLLRRLLVRGCDAVLREQLVTYLQRPAQREIKLGQISRIFAWGVRKGQELTGRLFRVHMTERRSDLGYTRMNENTIYISPLPVLTGDRHGRHVVEALILHEYGHHLYHRDELSQRVWKRAHAQGIGSILNLVADEHLERRLRAMDVEYGNRLKRLAAYAFQHSEREVAVRALLNMLLSSAFEALSVRPLGVAISGDAVIVDSGIVLRELDRRGHPYARFVRALRMGLGDRHDDSQLRAALALFKGGFRHLDMEGLYEIALTLAEIYGVQSELSKCFGGHESLEWDGRGARVHSDGVSDQDVQQEVERILAPPGPSGGPSRPGVPGKLAINVGEDEAFPSIDVVEPIPHDPAAHRSIATEVRRHAYRLRGYFEQIGLAHVPKRGRLRGRAFDRTRARAVVIRRDPRMLVARELQVRSDLFIGVVVDCSGSMSTGGSMDKAHRFGVLLAEAARGLPGVDARFFGFTASVIYDAGDDARCGVASLEAGGGNNDAAGLLYAASVAAASRRKAKLLVMVSDGLPTECSVAALRNLVQQLTRRRGMICAQVAVRALEEVCFPHYIELTDGELDRSVRRFGEIICTLAARAIGR